VKTGPCFVDVSEESAGPCDESVFMTMFFPRDAFCVSGVLPEQETSVKVPATAKTGNATPVLSQ